MVKKKTMKVFLANQTWADGFYYLHHGLKGTTDMNKPSHSKRFKKYSSAVKAKNQMVKKFKKKGYNVRYTYAAD